MKLNCGAKRHHYSMFDVGRSTFASFKTTLYGEKATCECLQNKLALMRLRPIWNVGIIPPGFLRWMVDRSTVIPINCSNSDTLNYPTV